MVSIFDKRLGDLVMAAGACRVTVSKAGLRNAMGRALTVSQTSWAQAAFLCEICFAVQ